ncbi:hypothetical protein BGY98DRAFT_936693 [Russula aff. rugulosa BPL654]|nr:hypothetical protein BGY98DRAFT_936693 [Russula aff. rugulosa BPL654]
MPTKWVGQSLLVRQAKIICQYEEKIPFGDATNSRAITSSSSVACCSAWASGYFNLPIPSNRLTYLPSLVAGGFSVTLRGGGTGGPPSIIPVRMIEYDCSTFNCCLGLGVPGPGPRVGRTAGAGVQTVALQRAACAVVAMQWATLAGLHEGQGRTGICALRRHSERDTPASTN